jgi:DNA phosphorothioation-associated putative methyltransferase
MSIIQAQVPHKSIIGRCYVHTDAFALLPSDALSALTAAERMAQVVRLYHFNVARFENSHDRVSLLNYPKFFEDAFPSLHESWLVDLPTGRVSYRSYRDSFNPPILHRKELMLLENHPRRAEFQALTETAETIGLFQDLTRIGFREQWLRLVREKGYQIVGHELIPIANDETTEPTCEAKINARSVARHLTSSGALFPSLAADKGQFTPKNCSIEDIKSPV